MTRTYFLILALRLIAYPAIADDTAISLTRWQASIDDGRTFQDVTVPGTIENAIDINFDGVSIYRTQLPKVDLRQDQGAILRFEAVATAATVFANGQELGKHLGGWTPFEFDITHFLRSHDSGQPIQLSVIVDEKVGHNTQGFLPIITHHFGGIWQPVTLKTVGPAILLADHAAVRSINDGSELQVQLPIQAVNHEAVQLECSLVDVSTPSSTVVELLNGDFQPEKSELKLDGAANDATTQVWTGSFKLPAKLEAWSPDSPQIYALRVVVKYEGQTVQQQDLRFGYRDFQAQDEQFVLNGQPISIRGVLNWGYAPPSLAPSLDPSRMRDEIQIAKDRGFNLMKFCLWIPPQSYLDLCDEMGMLAWVEYPTWHPQLDAAHLAELKTEYDEYYRGDRHHPSVILRSLTCETGSSAQLEVIQSLYDQCKALIPDAVVEDDSSWISWNRVHDFYDDHPYGNNHTWVKTLDDLKRYMAARTIKPLALGEAIAADSWQVPTAESIAAASADSAHGSWAVADNATWIEQLAETTAQTGRQFSPDSMLDQSIHYGQLMRKFQIETFHREIPYGGYVVSVIRDFPKASMGLIDAQGNVKSSVQDWQFHGDSMVLLQTEHDRRSFWAGETSNIKLITKSLAAIPGGSEIQLELIDDHGQVVWSKVEMVPFQSPMTAVETSLSLPAAAQPRRYELRTQWKNSAGNIAQNHWSIWGFPLPKLSRLALHSSAQDLQSQLNLLDSADIANDPAAVILARRLDDELIQRLVEGARVLLLPDGRAGSFPIRDQWFLRGSVVSMPKPIHENWNLPFELHQQDSYTDQDMLVELQHFDLAGPVMPNIGRYLSQIEPMVVLWDNHDMRETRTHGLAIQIPVGRGRLLVSTLNHFGQTNSAGGWLLNQWIQILESSSAEETASSAGQFWSTKLDKELNQQQYSLADREWHFQPDLQNSGADSGWHKSEFNDEQWDSIRIDRHWEGQGHAALDHWAWYRTTVELPQDWPQAGSTYLNLNGIDDYADIYVNGALVGSVGNIEKKETAFETRTSLDITQFVNSNQRITIAIAVYDWFGAGGIFRPITLSTEPVSEDPPILVPHDR